MVMEEARGRWKGVSPFPPPREGGTRALESWQSSSGCESCTELLFRADCCAPPLIADRDQAYALIYFRVLG